MKIGDKVLTRNNTKRSKFDPNFHEEEKTVTEIEEDGGIICLDQWLHKHRRHPDDVRILPPEADKEQQEDQNFADENPVPQYAEASTSSNCPSISSPLPELENRQQTQTPEGNNQVNSQINQGGEPRYPKRIRKPNPKYNDFY